jgi:hypothetical protein
MAEVKAASGQLGTQFLNRHIPPRLEYPQDQLRMRFDRGTAPVATQRPRPQVTRMAFQRTPTADTGSADLEARCRGAVAQTLVAYSSNNALS